MIMQCSEKPAFYILSQLILIQYIANNSVLCLTMSPHDLASATAQDTLFLFVVLLRHLCFVSSRLVYMYFALGINIIFLVIHSVPVCHLAKAPLLCLFQFHKDVYPPRPRAVLGAGVLTVLQPYLSLHPSTCNAIHKLMTCEDILQH